MSFSKKLDVGPLPGQTENYDYVMETSYRWDRIILVAVLIGLVAIVVIWGVKFINSSEIGKASVSESAQASNTPIVVSKSSNSGRVSAEQQERAMMAEHKQTRVFASDQSQTALSPKEHNSPLDQEPTPAQEVVSEVVPEVISEKATTDVAAPIVSAPQRIETIKILNPAIEQARLTFSIKNGQPTDKLGSLIKMSDEGIIKLFLFNRVHGIAGKVLFHEWYLEGKRIARVRLPIDRKDKRTASSKFINRQMLGNWQVKVVDETGKLYMTAEFRVVK